MNYCFEIDNFYDIIRFWGPRKAPLPRRWEFVDYNFEVSCHCIHAHIVWTIQHGSNRFCSELNGTSLVTAFVFRNWSFQCDCIYLIRYWSWSIYYKLISKEFLKFFKSSSWTEQAIYCGRRAKCICANVWNTTAFYKIWNYVSLAYFFSPTFAHMHFVRLQQ